MENTVSRIEREAAEDIFYGQVVINWARWFVIVAGTAFVMMAAETTTDLAIGMAPVVGLMVVNFYLHGRRLVNQPANLTLVGISSIIDVILITVVVIFGPSEDFQGLDSQFYVLYFPVIAAFSFVFGRKMAIVFTAATGAAYMAATVIAGTDTATSLLEMTEDAESLVTRVIVMLAIGGLGTYFWKVQRDRRHQQSTLAVE